MNYTDFAGQVIVNMKCSFNLKRYFRCRGTVLIDICTTFWYTQESGHCECEKFPDKPGLRSDKN